MNLDDELSAKTEDLFSLCDKHNKEKFSYFLDAHEQNTVSKIATGAELPSMLYGGYENSERKILGVFPQWNEPNCEDFPIDAVKISIKFEKNLSHRDYLGSILSLGIEHNRVGDILCFPKYSYVFLHNTITDFVIDGLTKISSVGVSCEKADISSITIPKKEFTKLGLVVSSLRLDCVVGAITALSRAKAQALISSDLVSINHEIINDTTKQLCQKDVISIKKHGRFILSEILGETRKGRIHINVLKYI